MSASAASVVVSGSEDHEFVSSDSGDRSAGRFDDAVHAAPDLDQNRVAELVAVPVVDLLEPVQVEQNNGPGVARPQHLPQTIQENHPVR